MKKNYEAWNARADGFFNQPDEKSRLSYLVRFAILAPSSHNSQPWLFEIIENRIIISPQLKRALNASDKNNRQLYTSLGTALENLLVAADYFGYQTAVEYPAKDGDSVRITFRSVREPLRDKEHSLNYIHLRHVNRGKYGQKLPDDQFLSWLKQQATPEMTIDTISNKEKRIAVTALVNDAMRDALDDRDFRSELSEYVLPPGSSRKTGMPALGLGVPFPVALFAPFLLKRINFHRLNRKVEDAMLIEHTPTFVVISANDNPENWVRVGQAFAKIALEAEKRGLNTAVLAAGIQIGNYYEKIKKEIGSRMRPQFFFRIGYAVKHVGPLAPRIPAERVLNI